MRVIGLTGGIASGKSTVARLLEDYGAVVIDADQLAREVVAPGEPAHAAIITAFGESVLAVDGTIDRNALGSLIFADAAARGKLMAITHPAIGRRAEERLDQLREAGAAVVVYMAPLLVEAGVTGRVDEIWVVYVDRETQLVRLMARDGIDRIAAEQKIASQMSMDEKRLHGRVIIDNRGDIEALQLQVQEIWQREIENR